MVQTDNCFPALAGPWGAVLKVDFSGIVECTVETCDARLEGHLLRYAGSEQGMYWTLASQGCHAICSGWGAQPLIGFLTQEFQTCGYEVVGRRQLPEHLTLLFARMHGPFDLSSNPTIWPQLGSEQVLRLRSISETKMVIEEASEELAECIHRCTPWLAGGEDLELVPAAAHVVLGVVRWHGYCLSAVVDVPARTGEVDEEYHFTCPVGPSDALLQVRCLEWTVSKKGTDPITTTIWEMCLSVFDVDMLAQIGHLTPHLSWQGHGARIRVEFCTEGDDILYPNSNVQSVLVAFEKVGYQLVARQSMGSPVVSVLYIMSSMTVPGLPAQSSASEGTHCELACAGVSDSSSSKLAVLHVGVENEILMWDAPQDLKSHIQRCAPWMSCAGPALTCKGLYRVLALIVGCGYGLLAAPVMHSATIEDRGDIEVTRPPATVQYREYLFSSPWHGPCVADEAAGYICPWRGNNDSSQGLDQSQSRLVESPRLFGAEMQAAELLMVVNAQGVQMARLSEACCALRIELATSAANAEVQSRGLRSQNAALEARLRIAEDKLGTVDVAPPLAREAPGALAREAVVADSSRDRLADLRLATRERRAQRPAPAEPRAASSQRPSRPSMAWEALDVQVLDVEGARQLCIECPNSVDRESIELERLPNGVRLRVHEGNEVGFAIDQDFQYDYAAEGHFDLSLDECYINGRSLLLVLRRTPAQTLKLSLPARRELSSPRRELSSPRRKLSSPRRVLPQEEITKRTFVARAPEGAAVARTCSPPPSAPPSTVVATTVVTTVVTTAGARSLSPPSSPLRHYQVSQPQLAKGIVGPAPNLPRLPASRIHSALS